MPTRIAATQLARGLGDVLGRIRYRGESFLIVRNGVVVAKMGPVTPESPPQLSEVLKAWVSMQADPQFSEDLAAVGNADVPVENPWDS